MDLMARRRAIMGMPSGKDYTVSGNVVSVSNALAKNAKSLIVSFSPKQSGSGDPSPNNIRPITGYNDISVVRYGKNLLFCDQSTATNHGVTATRNADGSFSLSGTATANGNLTLNAYEYLSDFGFFKAGETYVLSGGTSANMALIFGIYGSGTDYRDNGTGKTMSFTAEQIATKRYRLLLTITNGTNYDGVKVYPQIQYGSTVTTFEPYISPVTANVHSDTTIFGGTVDIASGELVVDRMLTTVSQLSWTKYSVTQGNLFRAGITNINASLNNPPTMSDQYKFVASASRADKTISRATSSAVDIIDNDYSDAASFKSAKGSVQICYPLANPITYTLTPSQLAMLKGNNTVYSNEGSISLTYVGK